MQRLLVSVIVQRRSPNEAIVTLVKSDPGITADEIQLTLLETVLHLEEMYDEVCRDEWNDWQRVDYFLKATGKGAQGRGGGAELLQFKSEIYRAIALIAADVIALRRGGSRSVTGADLLTAWQDHDSTYFS